MFGGVWSHFMSHRYSVVPKDKTTRISEQMAIATMIAKISHLSDDRVIPPS
jgi:hypothetical protein